MWTDRTHGDTPAQALTRALRAGLGRPVSRSEPSPERHDERGTRLVARGSSEGRRAVLAAGLGRMLDAFDVTLLPSCPAPRRISTSRPRRRCAGVDRPPAAAEAVGDSRVAD
jgi:hypothetical protein